MGPAASTGRPGSPPESYAKLLANAGGVLLVLAAIGLAQSGLLRPRPAPVVVESSPPTLVFDPAPQAPPPAPEPVKPAVIVVKPPELDKVAVARAEADLEAARRDRARAEARAEESARRLLESTAQASLGAKTVEALANRVRDPSARVAAANARGGFLKAENDKLKAEAGALARTPRPTAKVIANKNPVARPPDGSEVHFELRHDRISYVDIDRLIEKVKGDALLRIRLSDGSRVVQARVGPIGAFSLEYTLSRGLPAGLDDIIERRGLRYELRGWEVVPEFEGRGETYETTRQPISEFARVLARINPQRNAVTLWIYPDAFPLFRKLRDDLHARGFLVAARPLPDGVPIRGSPSGSLSAGQ